MKKPSDEYGGLKRAFICIRDTELVNTRRRLREARDSRRENISEAEERAAEEQSRGVELAIVDKNSNTLKDIVDAIARIDDGAYGTCEECGGEISKSRLKYAPFAKFCLICQEEKERSAAEGVTNHAFGGLFPVTET